MFEETFEGDCAVAGAKFPIKLWRLVNECQSGAISWGYFGKTVMIDFLQFQEEFLECPRPMFKTKNMASFIRQLNLYGFRKLISHKIAYANQASHYSTIHEFMHENFRLGRPDLLSGVKRRTLPVKLSCFSKNENILQTARRNFDDIWMSSEEFLSFMKISPDTLKLQENGDQVVEPVYQIQVIPALDTTIENGEVVAVLANKKNIDHLINFDMEHGKNESDESEPEKKSRRRPAPEAATISVKSFAVLSKKLEEIHYDDEDTCRLPQPQQGSSDTGIVEVPSVPAAASASSECLLPGLGSLPNDLDEMMLNEAIIDEDFYSSFVKSFCGST